MRTVGADMVLSSLVYLRADNASWSFFRQRIVELFAFRCDNASSRLVAEPMLPAVAVSPTWLPLVARTSPAGNRQRPHRGGHHERRTHGATARHQSPSRRPDRQANLLAPGPLRGLVPQVVAPLPGGRARGPLRPDPGPPPPRPAYPARAGEG